MWCVAGTLGSFLNEASRAAASLLFRFRLSPEALPSCRDDEAGTDWPAENSLEPLSGREGLDEEKRRWWPRMMTGVEAAAATAALGAADAARPAAVGATRRTEDGNMAMEAKGCRVDVVAAVGIEVRRGKEDEEEEEERMLRQDGS